ncbi:DUF2878 domain-containing protein [Vibrio ostreicida]|uniref:DUF2878 domain-containing protein n=1 Tax=Vibrio ostreicida TaxID=526588 RepID=A0ABT8BRX6_9VIBR|nr:DUF2878 domain-containing protein [Vibrio ostreicida]MDN3609678.1 DUF2878 domain-containing protein [Vibrio ostreicida]NPD09490.1 DUF2878 domain-containing protein [Vibrio ostreicida]
MSTWRLLIYSCWFQSLWFVAILGKESLQWLLVVMVLATYIYSYSVMSIKLFRLLLLSVVGVVVDVGNMVFGLFSFYQGGFPIWLVALWLIFVWYAYFLAPLLTRYPIALVSIVGGCAGVLSYFAGYKLGAVAFPLNTLNTLCVLLVEWVMLMTLIVKVFGYDLKKTVVHSEHDV